MRCRPLPPPSLPRHLLPSSAGPTSPPPSAAHPPHTVLLLFCIRIVSIHWHAPKPNSLSLSLSLQRGRAAEGVGRWASEREDLKAARPVTDFHNSQLVKFVSLFTSLSRERLRDPGAINLPSAVFNEFNRVSKTMWVNATANLAVLFLAREHDLSCVFISISVPHS